MTTALPDDHPVNRQLHAYNAHRLDDFVACFADDIVLTRPSGVAARGKVELRAAYEATFAVPGRHATILGRIAVGNWVFDHEEVTDAAGNRLEAAVGYHLVDGEIVEMRLFD